MLKLWTSLPKGIFSNASDPEPAADTLFVKSPSFQRAHQTAAPLRLGISKQNSTVKSIHSECGTRLQLQKASIDSSGNDFQWQLSDGQGVISVRHDLSYGLATIMSNDGTEITKLQRGGFSSVTKFKLGNKTYRWALDSAGDSKQLLKMMLLEDGCKDELAQFEGPGSQCKSFWINNPVTFKDSITVLSRTDSPLWVQLVIATGMVAAKMQRRHDKFLSNARRPNDWQC